MSELPPHLQRLLLEHGWEPVEGVSFPPQSAAILRNSPQSSVPKPKTRRLRLKDADLEAAGQLRFQKARE